MGEGLDDLRLRIGALGLLYVVTCGLLYTAIGVGVALLAERLLRD
ncbi:hypothetical protein [Mumia zhuanghuii]